MTSDLDGSLNNRIESIEAGYEFMLAYAAQGHETDKNAGQDQGIRSFLDEMDEALDELVEVATSVAEAHHPESLRAYETFLQTLDDDARKARGVISVVLAQSAISSQLIDNLNASIHLRALLTDLFVLDEVLKSTGRA